MHKQSILGRLSPPTRPGYDKAMHAQKPLYFCVTNLTIGDGLNLSCTMIVDSL